MRLGGPVVLRAEVTPHSVARVRRRRVVLSFEVRSSLDLRTMSAVRISVANLWTYRVADTDASEREPLSRLGGRRNAGHIHGTLVIEIAGRAVPHLGFFGPDDVCLNTWLVELCKMVDGLAGPVREYTFDEGEQGQPAFKFARVEDEVAFSINESVLGEGAADPEWQGVRFPYRDFHAAVLSFLDELRSELRQQAPNAWERWWPREAHLAT